MMKPLLVFGLDGCDPTTMRRYVKRAPEGLFARIVNEGVFTGLQSTWPYFTAPSWLTFATGLSPSWHGIYHWRGRYDAEQGTRPLISSQHVARATFWTWVQELGGRVSVSNFPMEYPAPAVSGRYICGTLAPEDAKNTTWPDMLALRLRKELPNFLFEMDKGLSYVDRLEELRAHIDEVGDNHYAALDRYCTGDFDFLCHVVTVTDRIQHFFWHHHDPNHPLAPDSSGEDPVLETYARAEKELMALWATGKFRNLVVLSDHGMGASFEAFHTDVWLVENGFAIAGPDKKVAIQQSLAYSGEEPECALYLNRIDRDGFGIDPKDLDEQIAKLSAALRAVTRPDGTPAFVEVHDARDLHTGPLADNAPDVILHPAHGVHPRPNLTGGRVFSNEARLMAGHRPTGILMLLGEDVPSHGEIAMTTQPSMEDIFPLMCQLMHIARPSALHGRIHPELSTAPAPEVDGLAWPDRVGEAVIPQAESASMMRRLKELGYADD